MVSTRNTSRSNANPLRMQDQPGNADNRPPGALETMQANTDEVEALRLTNQRLMEELEELSRQMQQPREAKKTQEGRNIPPHEGQHNICTPLGAKTEAESPKYGLQSNRSSIYKKAKALRNSRKCFKFSINNH